MPLVLVSLRSEPSPKASTTECSVRCAAILLPVRSNVTICPARTPSVTRLRLRLFSVAGRLVRGGRRLRLRLAERWPWACDITAAVAACSPSVRLTSPDHPCDTERTNPGAVEPRPPGATAGPPGTAGT
ncbi:hypothetical protein EAS64_19995 [Trebonia kvetii]|uniref:Transposase DDE domain-containing protein n=1 Tax=Trebonia kvetii TaxID=2480626 RepID=A0A6P2BWY1_9ACTN|nr:hypothetical protein EAS64_19995 [Trebonia kvetii]